MKFKVHGNDILCEDFTPNMKVGVFTDAITSESQKKLILDSNFGQEFMALYQRYRTNMHIVNIAELMHKMELLHDTYEGELMKIRRKGE